MISWSVLYAGCQSHVLFFGTAHERFAQLVSNTMSKRVVYQYKAVIEDFTYAQLCAYMLISSRLTVLD